VQAARQSLRQQVSPHAPGAVGPIACQKACAHLRTKLFIASSLKTERTARKVYRTREEAKADVFDYIERFYNRASEHPSCYVIEEKRFCWSGCDPAGVADSVVPARRSIGRLMS
jgi:transposase InsO family protein